MRTPGYQVPGDDLIYVALSYSLERGEYRDDFLVGSPPHVQYPPGMPLWILGVRALVGDSSEHVPAANLAALAVAAALLGLATARFAGPWVGVAAIGLVALEVELLLYAGRWLAEIPFFLFSALAIWAAPRDGRRHAAVAIVATLAAMAMRTIGVALAGALFIQFVVQRRFRAAAVHVLLTGTAAGAWYGYVRSVPYEAIGISYATDLKLGAAMGAGQSPVVRAARHAGEYLLQVSMDSFNLPALPGAWIDNVLWFLLWGVPAAVGVWALRRTWPMLGAYLGATMAILAVWPWVLGRYLAPIVPLLSIAAMIGIVTLLRGRREAVPTAIGLAVLLTVGGLGRARTAIAATAGCEAHRGDDAAPCLPEALQGDFARAALWIRANSDPAAIVYSVKPAAIYHFAARSSQYLDRLLPPRCPPDVDCLALLNTPVYLVIGQVVPSEQYVARNLAPFCRRFALRHRVGAATFVLQYLGEDGPAAGAGACDVLARAPESGEP